MVINNIYKMKTKWQMLFNFAKCTCLHTGHEKLDVNYKMGDTVLGTTVREKDLGITISADMKVSKQCGIAASKGNQILGLNRRNITYKDTMLIIPLYKQKLGYEEYIYIRLKEYRGEQLKLFQN